MANHALPTTTSTYANFVTELDGRLDDLAFGLDPAVTTATNVPTNAIRWNSASKYWEKYNGTAWAAMSASYSININGTVGATTASTGAFTTLSTTGIASLAASSTVGGNAIVTVSDNQTLTNKTLTSPVISTITNTGTLTLPTSTDTIVGRATTDTLTNKTLTAPRFADLGFIADSAGAELIIFDSVATAVNEITISNAATGGIPTIAASGETNVSLNLTSKGTGTVQANGLVIANTTGSQTLTNKTLTTPVLSGTASGTTAGALGYLSGAFTYGNGTVQRTVVNTDESQTLTNKTMSTGSAWQGTQVGVTYGGTGTTTAPTQGGIIYGSSTSAYASTAAGTTYQVLQSNGSSAPTWASIDLSLHAADSSYKKIVRVATTADLGASTFAANALTGYDDTFALALTTTAASTTITTTSTAGLKVGAVISTATTQIAAGTSVASITNATTFTVNNRAAITTTAITGSGATATATFAAQTYAPYAVGSTIVVSGATPATYNGSFVVTACTTTTVAWASTETVAASVQGAINFTIAAGTSISTNFAQTIAALTVDGIALTTNDRVLVKDQSALGGLVATDTAKYNGIYTVTNAGSTTVPWVLTRTGDADTSTDLDGALVNVSVGTANGGKSFKTYFLGTSTLNTTPMYWNRLVDASASALIGTPTTAIGIDMATDTKTQTLVAGAVTDLAVNSLGVTTVAATAASTYTRASTLYIAGAPAAGTNATITTPYALYIAGGNAYLAGTTTLNGAVTANSTINGLTLASTSLTSAAATNLTVTAGTTGVLSLDSGSTGAVNLGTNANAKTITIGNATGATAVNINTGTGGTLHTTNSAYTNTVVENLRLVAATSGTAAIGSGVGLGFSSENASGTQVIGMRLDAITTDVTAATEDFDLVVKLMAAGAAATEKFRVTSTGNAKAAALFDVSAAADTATAATHYYVETATDGFLRPKTLANAQAELVTTATVAATTLTAGSASAGALKYNGTTATAGQFDGGTTTPTGTTRLNYGGYFYPTFLNLIGSGDTATAASHYFVETGSDGYVRPKTLANTQAEIVTTATVAAAGALGMGTSAKTAAYTVVAADRGDILLCSNTWTLTLTAAATLGNGFSFGVANTGTGTITIDPNLTETVDGSTTKALTAGQSCILVTDGTSWRTVGLSGDGAVAGGVLYENGHTISSSYTLSTGKSAHMVGPLTVASGQTLTVPTGEALIVFGSSPTNDTTDVLIKGAQTFIGQKTFETMPIVAVPPSMVRVNTANGYGSTATVIRRFSNIVTNQGVDITYADSATNGATFTINTNGVYAISYTGNPNGINFLTGISLNTSQVTTTVGAINTNDRLAMSQAYTTGATTQCSWTGYLSAGSIIRAHEDGNASSNASAYHFTITRVA